MSISVSNITKIYGSQKALDNVTFDIPKGEIVGFLGPNGAGKSTMMKILTCFLPQTEGLAKVCGLDVTHDALDIRKKIGYLPENNPLYHDMYVREYLEFVAKIHGINGSLNARINEMISLTGLEIEKKKQIGALSKGYRQRVGLAQAMIHDPEVLILDEPTTGLDPNQLQEIRGLIKSLGKEKTVILSTHIMQEVSAICGRVIIINKGKIVADDTTEALLSQGSTDSVVLVEFDVNVAQERLKRVHGVASLEKLSDQKWKIKSRSGVDIRKELFKFAIDNELTVLTMQRQDQSLEDVFKTLTSHS